MSTSIASLRMVDQRHIRKTVRGCTSTIPVGAGNKRVSIYQGIAIKHHRDFKYIERQHRMGDPRRQAAIAHGIRQLQRAYHAKDAEASVLRSGIEGAIAAETHEECVSILRRVADITQDMGQDISQPLQEQLDKSKDEG